MNLKPPQIPMPPVPGEPCYIMKKIAWEKDAFWTYFAACLKGDAATVQELEALGYRVPVVKGTGPT